MAVSSLSTLITFNPWAVGPTVPVEEIAEQLKALQIRHVPVVDDQRRVVGMISESDVLRAWQRRAEATSESAPGIAWDGALAREIMTREVVTITPQVSFKDALRVLLQRPIHALPVVENDQLLGVISSRDFLREFSYGELPGGRQTLQELLSTRPVEWLESDMPLEEALLTMQRQGVAALPVVKGGCPLGVVTQRAIVRARRGSGRPASDQVKDAATERPVGAAVGQIAEASPILRPGERLCEAAAAMIHHRTSAVLVVNASHRLLGMVTEDDLLRVLYDALA
jgi:acetoin utilization protein AcuB